MNSTIIVAGINSIRVSRRSTLSSPASFKEASFVEGRLMRIARKKVEILVDDGETGEPSLIAIKLAEGVNIGLETIGEDVKAVIVDGKVALITPLKIDVPRDEASSTAA